MGFGYQVSLEDIAFVLRDESGNPLSLDNPLVEKCFNALTKKDHEKIERFALKHGGEDIDDQSGTAATILLGILNKKGLIPKKKFKVDIIRTASQCLEVEIEAIDSEDALQKAYEMSGNLDFSNREKSCEYECTIMGKIE